MAPQTTRSEDHLKPPPGDDPHDRKRVTVFVNERPVTLADKHVTGLEIKQAAIAAGIAVQVDFILVYELESGRTQIIGDEDRVKVEEGDRFLANDGDDDA